MLLHEIGIFIGVCVTLLCLIIALEGIVRRLIRYYFDRKREWLEQFDEEKESREWQSQAGKKR